MILWLLATLALADEHRLVRPGDTLDGIAADTGVAAGTLRQLNGLTATDEPGIGTLLTLSKAPDPDAGAVCALTGTATVRIGRAAPAPIHKGDTIPGGSTLCTEAGSYATVCLARDDRSYDHDNVTLFPETCIEVRSTAEARGGTSLVALDRGQVTVPPARKPGGDVVVVTRDAVTATRQGGLRVVLEAEATRAEAVSAAAVIIAGGVAVDLAAGEGSRAKTGEAPGDPVKLRPPVLLDHPRSGETLWRPAFGWSPTERALGYRIEVSRGADFADLVVVEDVPGTEWTPETLFVPYRGPGLYWRVSAFDRLGFQGVPSEARRVALPPGVGP